MTALALPLWPSRHMLTMIQIAPERKAMRTSLYDLSVPTFLQTVRSIGGFLDRAATHFQTPVSIPIIS
jgi:hypothetical protein